MRVVVKLGGSVLQPTDSEPAGIQEISRFVQEGHEVAVVHGGGPAITNSLTEAGVPVTFYQGQRVTTPDVLRHVVRVLRGEVNMELVLRMNHAGIAAVGLSGVDGQLFRASRMHPPELGNVGVIDYVATNVVTALWRAGFVPVIAPLALGSDGNEILNCNGDGAASALARWLKADVLVFYTESGGLRESPEPSAGLVRRISELEIGQWIAHGRATQGMVPKLQAAQDALKQGVKTVLIGSYYDFEQGATEVVKG
ncbi:MAG: acetylglutamate kinase [Sulfobacillus thermotolerans]|uniref:acetylglutamate kinase n=1 Tax=Sulfobacillus thermotolerans TaxID=338644 RepID=A0ABN5GY04_9FIRM|nr:acetylglutamate kinase [Sulfobacillus thermotolerans]MCY0906996.1 acetylglutamate kinase [Sulfobacillus thermotolerans]